jgi:hypothetical protein
MRIPLLVFGVAIFCVTSAVDAQNASPGALLPESSTSVSKVANSQKPIGGVEALSDTQGVDFKPYLTEWHRITEATWQSLIPKETNQPIQGSGEATIRFKILPNGQVMDGSLQLEGRSGNVALDRAAWGAITGSDYPRLPEAFKGPFLELRASFDYNKQSVK